MSGIPRTLVAAALCGIVFGCDKAPEAPKPPAPPAAAAPKPPAAPPAAAPVTPPAVAPIAPPTGPSLTPPGTPEIPPAKSAATGASGAPNVAKRSVADDLKVVQSVLAKAMNIKPEAVEPTKTLADLKMTGLDLSDAVMELEDKLKVSIPKSSLQKAAETDMPYELVDKLTVQKFAEVVNASQPKK